MHRINSFIILLAYFLPLISVLEGHLAEKHMFNGLGEGGGSTGAKWVGGWLGAVPKYESKANCIIDSWLYLTAQSA